MGVPHTVDQPPDDTLDRALHRLAALTEADGHESAPNTTTVEDSVRRIETRMEDPDDEQVCLPKE